MKKKKEINNNSYNNLPKETFDMNRVNQIL